MKLDLQIQSSKMKRFIGHVLINKWGVKLTVQLKAESLKELGEIALQIFDSNTYSQPSKELLADVFEKLPKTPTASQNAILQQASVTYGGNVIQPKSSFDIQHQVVFAQSQLDKELNEKGIYRLEDATPETMLATVLTILKNRVFGNIMNHADHQWNQNENTQPLLQLKFYAQVCKFAAPEKASFEPRVNSIFEKKIILEDIPSEELFKIFQKIQEGKVAELPPKAFTQVDVPSAKTMIVLIEEITQCIQAKDEEYFEAEKKSNLQERVDFKTLKKGFFKTHSTSQATPKNPSPIAKDSSNSQPQEAKPDDKEQQGKEEKTPFDPSAQH